MKEISSDKLAYNILQLQNLIKRDPPSYYDEFFTQYQHYKSLIELFKTDPSEYNKNIADLAMFLAQVSACYKDELASFPEELMQILRDYASVLDPNMRLYFCKALILMRNKNVLAPLDLITLSFELLRCRDKILRQYLQVFIISDIKNLNFKHKNVKVNSALQNFMFKMLADRNAIAAKVSLDIMIELYRRNVWKDAKTVNAISTACFSRVNKVLVAALKFFLGVDEEDDNDEDNSDSSDEEAVSTVKEVALSNKVNKKSRKRIKMLARVKQVLKKSKKKKKKEVFDFSAIHLIHDPQGMAEKLLKSVQSMNERFEIKLLVMNVISRLIGVHELLVLNYYPLLIRYLKPHQRDVTQILMFAAQAAHEQVPPDVMGTIIKTIADNFITERNAGEVITVGLNSIREICIRCPLAIEQDLLQDLVQYEKYKNKNVMMSAKSLIQAFRQINPKLLQRKFRSRPTEKMKELETLEYGALKAKSYIPGTEVLPLEPSHDDSNDEKTIDDDEEYNSDASCADFSHSENELPDSEEDNENNTADKNKCKNTEESSARTETDNTEIIEGENKSAHDEESGLQIVSKTEKAIVVSQSRILSQEEFQKLKVTQLAKEVQFAKGKKRAADTDVNELSIQRSELVSLSDIERLHKKPKMDREAKLAAIKENKEGREKFGRKKKKHEFSSKSLKEQRKNKPFTMIKHKVRSKVKRSFKDKQIALRNALLKRKKNK